MIKFFRKIRQRLLKEGRLSSYLLYAIGEIVLVVIGILIALQISTWSRTRQESDKVKSYLRNIEADLNQQLAYIDIQLEFEYNCDSLAKSLLARYRKEQALAIDSVSSGQLYNLTIRNTFTKADPTYQDLISTGNIGLIKDELLRNEILNYYLELERFETIMMINNTLYVDEMFAMKMVNNAYMVSDVQIGNTDRRLFEVSNEMLEVPEHEMLVINLIKIREDIAVGHVKFMNELKEKTESMLDVIQNHIILEQKE
ncbi:DUF6090 family protein [Cryomorphaceae bacterium 1068]|nr:DUF6090 family protein [Cryomorphaceae bacterium 1068]